MYSIRKTNIVSFGGEITIEGISDGIFYTPPGFEGAELKLHNE